jgi:hypothetical protein
VGVGPFFSNVVLFIVILTTAISLDRQADDHDAARLRAWAERGTPTAAACIGTFVLAESGSLDRMGLDHNLVACSNISPAIFEGAPG